MYDSLILSINAEDVGVDFMAETSQHFEVTGEHNFRGAHVISGTLDNLKLSVNARRLKINGSLCKWFLGDNMQTLGRGDTKRAIEKLSDTLHLPISQADVTRVDIAQNLVMRYETAVYYNHLGSLQYYSRFLQSNSLYYQNSKRALVFYDKNKEMWVKGGTVPEVYTGRHVLRYEMRYKSRLREQFKQPEVKASLLYYEPFYIDLVNRWLNEYKSIQKLNTVTLNFDIMRTKRELYILGLASLVEKSGGEIEFIQQINEAYQTGRLTKKQAFDMKKAVKEACHAKYTTVESDVVSELDEKVKQAARFYR